MRTTHPLRPAPATPVGQPLLRVSDLRVRYGGIEALRGVSLEVRRGEVVALIGANGAGKTTTLRAVARLLQPSGGAVTFDGQSLLARDTEDAVQRGVALVPEGRGVFPNLTVRDNLDLGAWNHRHRATMAESLDDVVGLFPRLGERMKQEAGTLSGGEQQMLAIGRALMARPALLLLDEPSLGIAPMLVRQIFEAIRTVAAAGTTILVVEQNTRVALGSSQRAYVMRTGEIVREGESRQLADDPEIQAAYLGG
ncbi:MAG: ABC transporter ATP-binding protein [Myxococcales bacterium]|nr:MAG: ABC transporter ATP-binding protein [Myxococcales bacterium]